MKERYRAICITIILGGLIILADQLTKQWVRETIPLNTSYMPIPWLDRVVTLTHIENRGVAFGLLQGLGGTFALVAVLVVGGIGWYLWRYPHLPRVLPVVFGLMLGGAVGNLIDRLARDGAVTDFVDLRWWPVFNVADSCLVVGAVLLGVYTLFYEGRGEESASDASSTEPGAGGADGA
ncbi:MAG: signal peptidase II [Anaerolineales bacterium]